MPTYEYVCSKCDEQFELVQSIKESAIETCPKDQCKKKRWGKGKVKRVIGAGSGLIFKGSGFYITDYRSDSYKEAAKKDVPSTAASSSETKSSGTKKDSGKKESKPASTASGAAS